MKKLVVKLVILGLMILCMLPVAGATSSDTGVSVCSEEDIEPNWVF